MKKGSIIVPNSPAAMEALVSTDLVPSAVPVALDLMAPVVKILPVHGTLVGTMARAALNQMGVFGVAVDQDSRGKYVKQVQVYYLIL